VDVVDGIFMQLTLATAPFPGPKVQLAVYPDEDIVSTKPESSIQIH